MPNLDSVLQELRKKYGEKAIITANEMGDVVAIPTYIPTLDVDLGGGFLLGRTNLIAGRPGTGKTSLAYKFAGVCQNKYDMPVYWIDTEKAFDINRAKLFGLDGSKTIVFRDELELTAEAVFELMKDVIRGTKASVDKDNDDRALFVIDSLAMTLSEKVVEKAASAQYSGSALMVNQIVGVSTVLLSPRQILLLINQYRQNLDPMADPDVLPAGMAQLYSSSTITGFRGAEVLKEGTIAIGQKFRWTIKKSRAASPREIGEVSFYYDTGYDIESNLIEAAIELELVEQGGAGYFTLPGGERIRGKDKFIEKIKSDKDFIAKLYELVYQKMNTPVWDGK